jgi:hypothetical protein
LYIKYKEQYITKGLNLKHKDFILGYAYTSLIARSSKPLSIHKSPSLKRLSLVRGKLSP